MAQLPNYSFRRSHPTLFLMEGEFSFCFPLHSREKERLPNHYHGEPFGNIVSKTGHSHWNYVVLEHEKDVGSEGPWRFPNLNVQHLVVSPDNDSHPKWPVEAVLGLCQASSQISLFIFLDEKSSVELLGVFKSNGITLENLRIDFKCAPTDAEGKLISEYVTSQFPTLHEINLSNIGCSSTFADEVASLGDILQAHNTRLEVLSLEGVSDKSIPGDEIARRIGEALQNPYTRLRKLYLERMGIGDDGAKYVGEGLQKSPHNQLQRLSLAFNNITDKGAACLAQALRSPSSNLCWLRLWYNKIGDDGARCIAQSSQFPHTKMQNLDLSYNEIGDGGARWIAESLQSPHTKIQTLDLSFNKVGDDGAQRISQSLQSPDTKMKTLDLSFNQIGDDGARQIAECLQSPHTKMQCVILRGNQIEDVGATLISKSLNGVLQKLDLTECPIGEEGVKHLASSAEKEDFSLTHLGLSVTTDQQLIHIAESLGSSKLQVLRLSILRGTKEFKDATINKFLAAQDCYYWGPLLTVLAIGRIHKSFELASNSLASRNEAIAEGDLLKFERQQPSSGKLFVCGESTPIKQQIMKNILQSKANFKKPSESHINLHFTAIQHGNLQNLLVLDVQERENNFPFFSSRPRQSLFLVVCNVLEDGQLELNRQLRYWLKSIASTRNYHGPANVMLCLVFSVQYFSRSSKPCRKIKDLREIAQRRTKSIIDEFQDVVDFGVSITGVSENVFATVDGKGSEFKHIKQRMKILFQELQSKEFNIPRLCVDLLRFFPTFWKKQFDKATFPVSLVDHLVSSFQAHGTSQLNIEAGLQLLHSKGYLVYNSTSRIIIPAPELLLDQISAFRNARTGDPLTFQEDIVERLLEIQVHPDLVYKVLHWFHHAGIIRGDWSGGLSQAPKVFRIPMLENRRLPKWPGETLEQHLFWGRRLHCIDKERTLFPQEVFMKFQARQLHVYDLAAEWVHLDEGDTNVIVKIGKHNQWIDFMFRIPKEERSGHDFIFSQLVDQIHEVCYAEFTCSTLKFKELEVIRDDAIRCLELDNACTAPLSLIMTELDKHGIEYMHLWSDKKSTKVKDLLSPLEVFGYYLNVTEEIKIEFNLGNNVCEEASVADYSASLTRKTPMRILEMIQWPIYKLLPWLIGIDRLQESINQRFDQLEGRMEGRFDQMKENFDQIAKQLDKLEACGAELIKTLTADLASLMGLVDQQFPKFPYLTNKDNVFVALSSLIQKKSYLNFMCEFAGGAHHVNDDHKKFELVLTREWVVRAAPMLVPALKIVVLTSRIIAAGLSLGVCPLPLPTFTGETMMRKAVLPEVLKQFASGLEEELKKGWADIKPDPALLKEFLQLTLKDKRLRLRDFGLFRVRTPSGIKYLCDQHSKGYERTENQLLYI